jgi:uncharacterized protein involved in exopolysaccharide biosynthesis
MSNQEQETLQQIGDEISLYELYLIIKRKRILISSATIICAIVAGTYGLIKPTNYAYQACVQM